jgi:hypothetical protein
MLSAAAMLFVGAAPSDEIQRPADLEVWPTLGTTVRMSRMDESLPGQMRHVQMDPADYAAFVAHGAYPDGAAFAVTFYDVARDDSHTPPLYRAGDEVAFAMEIIDRTHADGRRFYTFAPGETRAAALPPGNACAVCHNTGGAFDGTFSEAYPAIRAGLSSR